MAASKTIDMHYNSSTCDNDDDQSHDHEENELNSVIFTNNSYTCRWQNNRKTLQ